MCYPEVLDTFLKNLKLVLFYDLFFINNFSKNRYFTWFVVTSMVLLILSIIFKNISESVFLQTIYGAVYVGKYKFSFRNHEISLI